MKKTYLLLIAAGLMSLAACHKVIEETTVVEDDTVVSYTYIGATAKEDGTKGSINGGSGDFTWNTGDQIAVWAGGDDYCVSEELDAKYNGSATATFAFNGLNETNRAYFAIYPASLADSDHHDGTDLVVNLPGRYTLSQLQGEVTPIPMIAVNAPDGNLEFKQLCALLRLTVNSVPPSAKRLELDFAGNKVHGSFAVSLSSGAVTPGTSVIETACDSADDIITITPDGEGDTFNNGAWLDGLVLNIPIPLGTYTTVKVSAFDALTGGNEILAMTRPVKVGADWTPARRGARKVTASLPAFSVSDNVRVHIAKSNLQLTRPDTEKTWEKYQEQGQLTWSFMEHPWSRETATDIEVDHANKTAVRCFSWGTSGHNFNAGIANEEDYIYGKYYQPWNTADGDNNKNADARIGSDYGPKGYNLDLTGNFVLGDWGRKICVEDDLALNDGYGYSKDWRLLTGPEAEFLFGKVRYPSSDYSDTGDASPEDGGIYTKRFHNWGFGYINTDAEDAADRVCGLIILPDYFVDPTGSFIKAHRNAQTTSSNNLTEVQWALMEAAGAAFLPTSIRILRKQNYENGVQCGFGIYSWTSSGSTTQTTHASFIDVSGSYNNAKLYPYDQTAARRNGLAVRLVRVLN